MKRLCFLFLLISPVALGGQGAKAVQPDDELSVPLPEPLKPVEVGEIVVFMTDGSVKRLDPSHWKIVESGKRSDEKIKVVERVVTIEAEPKRNTVSFVAGIGPDGLRSRKKLDGGIEVSKSQAAIFGATYSHSLNGLTLQVGGFSNDTLFFGSGVEF